MNRILSLDNLFEDGCVYTADRSQYDVCLEQTIKSRDEFHLKYMFDYKKREMPIAFYLKGRKNVTLDFAGATLKLHGQIQPILLEDCENITVKNCVIEYDRAAHSEAEILEITEDTVRLKFGDAFPYRVDVENKGLIFTSDTWESTSRPSPLFYQPFDKESRLGLGLDLGVTGENIIVPEDWPYPYWHFLAEEDGDTVILHGAHPSGWKVGNIIAIPHEARWLTALTTMNCRNIHIQNFRIINGFSMGLAPFNTENFYVDRLIATYDSRSRGIISNTADLIHAVGCKGEMIIENSVFEGMIDDALNVHGNFLSAINSDGCTLHVQNTSQLPTSFARIFNVGDTIASYNGPTMERIGIGKIESITWIDGENAVIVTDVPVEVSNGGLIENLSTQPNLTVRNCVFGKANSHIRLQTRGKVLFENSTLELPIILTGDASYWYESSPVQDLTIQNCSFTLPRAIIQICPEFIPTPKAPYYHENIKIMNNTFVSQTPLIGGYSNNIVFTGNTNSASEDMTIILTSCGSCVCDNATVERITKEKTEMNRG